MRTPSRLVLVAAAAGTLLAVASPASAAHESSNKLTFVGAASGTGSINYVKGTSGEEPDSSWTSSFRFSGLAAGDAYVVTTRGRFTSATEDVAICDFVATSAGTGGCAARFTGLMRLGRADLYLGSGEDGMVITGTSVATASRAAGNITSSPDCREPGQGGSQCAAPGRQ